MVFTKKNLGINGTDYLIEVARRMDYQLALFLFSFLCFLADSFATCLSGKLAAW